MIVLAVDTETTGIDTNTANILEIAAVRYQVEDCVWTHIDQYHAYVFQENYLPLPEDALKVNGLTEKLLREKGISFADAFLGFNTFAHGSEYVIAHNEPYDKGVLKSQMVRHNLAGTLFNHKWICSLNDVEEFVGRKCRKLSHLAVDFGLTVDGSKLHGAIFDVLLLGELATKLRLNPTKMWEYRNEPTLILATPTTPPWEDNGKDKDAAKAAGYGWERVGDKTYPKQWVKGIKKSKLDLEKRKYRILEEV